MIKKFLYGLSLLLIFLGLVQHPIFAKAEKDYSDEEISQVSESGDFKLRDHPGLRARVFVHNQKPGSSPSLVCNLPDPDSTAVTGMAGWHLPSSWVYTLNINSVPSTVGSANLSTIASLAFGKWSGAVGGKVVFSKNGTNTSTNRAAFDGKNIIAWGKAPSGALAVTYTWYYTSNHQAAEEDTIFNSRYPWSWAPYSSTACVSGNTYDAQDILTHETGHWMGLDDEYSTAYVNNTMYGYGSTGEIKKDTLTTGDITGVQAIYP